MSDNLPGPVKFLLVDDLEENLLSLDALLRREDLVLLKAKNGTQALELLLEHDVALALLDVQMPDMNGFELAELMRGMERTKKVPIIFLTAGSTDTSRRFRGYEAGAVDFLHKPLEPDVLRSKANVFFDLRRQQRLLEMHRDQLEEADRRKDEFLATLAHELRNPLAPIRNGLEILNLSPETAKSTDVLSIMDRQLTHLVRLIDDLLDVSRISKGKIELRREKITLQSAIQSALESCKKLIDDLGHNIHMHIPDDDIWVNADPTRLAQIISNLLNNAAKYTPVGGRIEIDLSVNEGHAILTITDNGVGIENAKLPHIFDMFTQVGNQADMAKGGLGIGLSLVKKLVDMHEGSISAESAGLGHGSRFTLIIPRSASPAIEKSSTTSTSFANNTPLSIMVVDDNIPSAQTIAWMLELIGHAPVMAHTAADALAIAGRSKFDVVVLDIGLPDMNGYDLCRQLKKDPALEHTVFIAQTGWGQQKDRMEAFDAGFNHHLVKPVNLKQFSELLSNIKPHINAA